jgi:hypothetical protein
LFFNCLASAEPLEAPDLTVRITTFSQSGTEGSLLHIQRQRASPKRRRSPVAVSQSGPRLVHTKNCNST